MNKHAAAPLSPDDPRLTALALGEIHDPAERAALEAQVAADPALRAALDGQRAFAGELRGAMSCEPLPFVNPAAIAAKAMGEAPSARRRSSGLGGSLGGPRCTEADERKSRLITFGGLATAAAACLALVLLSRPDAREGATQLVAHSKPSAAEAPTVPMVFSPSRTDLASLARSMPGLPVSGAAFRPAGRAPLALAAPHARAYAAAFSRELAAGRRPVDSRIRLDGLVNAFIAARPMAPGSRPVQIETALTDAPWNPEHRLLRVTVRAHGTPGEIVAKNAAAEVDFDAAGVKSWRVLGHTGALAAPTHVALRGGETITTLYEIEPADASADARLASVTVRYARADRSGADTATAELSASRRQSLADTDADTRFAAGLAAYALNLGDNPVSGLALAAGDDPERREFAARAR